MTVDPGFRLGIFLIVNGMVSWPLDVTLLFQQNSWIFLVSLSSYFLTYDTGVREV
jgi:hypothetical protein